MTHCNQRRTLWQDLRGLHDLLFRAYENRADTESDLQADTWEITIKTLQSEIRALRAALRERYGYDVLRMPGDHD